MSAPPTFCYVIKPQDENEELRYSLRSVAEYYPESTVIIAGYKPSWVTGVQYIPVDQVPGEKHANSLRNQMAVFTNDGLPEAIWMIDDDVFFLDRRGDQPTTWHWGYVEDVLLSYGPSRLGNIYWRSMLATLEILRGLGIQQPLSYAMHTPHPVHRASMAAAIHRYRQPGVNIQHATIAGNLDRIGGVKLPHGDVKVYDQDPWTPLPSWLPDAEVVSTTDLSFLCGGIGKHIRRRFPSPSRYEYIR